MAVLRGEKGCPWDKEQTHQSLRPYLIEESYEVIEAIDLNDPAKIREELGDLLLQVVFHAQLAEEAGTFTYADVVDGICEKMIRRHPHVFGEVKVDGVAGVLDNWQKIKAKEKGEQPETKTHSLLKGIPPGIPALQRAEKVQSRATKVGFDWPSIDGPLDKVREELDELLEVWRNDPEAARWTPDQRQDRLEEEFGDLLFALVNVGRFLHLHPELALNRTVDKFVRRFKQMEQLAQADGKALQEMDLQAMDKLWEQVKAGESAE
jgi:tetrapyrrole methylase family protein/MazG family protein